MGSIKDRCAIVGIGETEYSRDSGQTELSLAIEAIKKAVEDAGLSLKDIDGILKYVVDSNNEGELAACLGIPRLRFYGELGQAGGAGCGLVGHAALAISHGIANNVVVFRAVNGRSGRRYGSGAVTGQRGQGNTAFWEPYGLLVPGQHFALQARRHIYEYGTTSQQFGAVAVACRKHACLNPRAMMYGRPMTLEDHQNSRMVHDPLRLLDCCLETDGGCAIVITSAERSRDLKQRPVYIMSFAQGLVPGVSDILCATEGTAKYIAAELFARAGITSKDVNVVQLYDQFTSSVIIRLEDYGFCKKGEGGAFVEGGRIELGGELPVNTAGGHLSEAYLHGMNHVIEAVRQLRGTSTAQVENAEIALSDSGSGLGAIILRR